MASQFLFIGTTELLLIGGIALLLFGGKKLPEMMKGLGQGVQSFKQGMNEPLPEQKKDEGGEEQPANEEQADK
ncbi:MAG: twin-arginine translocase TatA/TatE family subunit [Prevotella sp.]|nr:twin-arginine translocase TatA/TatE family subunit [Prevotella sp.]MBR1839965.1 twin-arginine translocase TatA/TatE family subunit [Prevotella sp.]